MGQSQCDSNQKRNYSLNYIQDSDDDARPVAGNVDDVRSPDVTAAVLSNVVKLEAARDQKTCLLYTSDAADE